MSTPRQQQKTSKKPKTISTLGPYSSALLFIVLFVGLVTPGVCFLDVYIPECAKQIIPNPIPFTLSNFGYIPYGQSYIGQVYLPKGENNSQLCTIQNEPQIPKSAKKSILMVKRGECRFTQKVLLGQKLGADMVIIYDNESSVLPHVIMKNDGHGHLVNIPSVFVSGTSGEQLIRAYNQCSQDLFLKHSFDVFESEIVEMDLWLNLNNRESYVLLRDFEKYNYYDAVQNYINMHVGFRVDRGCKTSSGWCSPNDCLGNLPQGAEQGQLALNRYCMPIQLSEDKAPEKTQISGSQLLKQSLRMYVLFDMMPKSSYYLWFKYMNQFDENICNQLSDVETCSYETMSQVGIDKNVIESIKANISATLSMLESKELNTENTFFWLTGQADEKNIIFYPQAIINGKNFYGLFKAPDVFEMVCQSLLNQPKECYSFIKNKNSPNVLDQTEGMWTTVLFIVLLMTVGFLVALFIYTRLIKREVNQQMSMEINKMVQNYVSLTDQKSGKNLSEQESKGSFEKVKL